MIINVGSMLNVLMPWLAYAPYIPPEPTNNFYFADGNNFMFADGNDFMFL